MECIVSLISIYLGFQHFLLSIISAICVYAAWLPKSCSKNKSHLILNKGVGSRVVLIFIFRSRGWVLYNYFFGDLECLYFILFFLGPNPSWVHQPGITKRICQKIPNVCGQHDGRATACFLKRGRGIRRWRRSTWRLSGGQAQSTQRFRRRDRRGVPREETGYPERNPNPFHFRGS